MQVCILFRIYILEVIQVEFSPEQISYEDILTVFFATHDPTTLNRQGYDSGTQYRSAIFYHSDEQKKIAEKIKEIAQKEFQSQIVTEITAASDFYKAENYHQNFFNSNSKHGYCTNVIKPKVEKFQKRFKELLKQ